MANVGLVTLIIGFLFLMPAAAVSQGLPAGRWWRDPRVIQQLGLTNPEIDRLEQAYTESRRRLIQSKGALEAERFELETMFEKNKFNETAARQQFERLEQKRAALAESRFQFVIKVRKILGPERFQKLLDFYQQGPGPPRPNPPRRKAGPIP
ncbi:MAG: periplasmic heavy metal sensor [Deltaproteobacteria bacterium]|nr:periplasmic heavy metal sensor [Deltaproteobacteria bacterium]MBW1956449.1 periplasmic heavy metal sensor [Deltaproteobacteria bacterium]MBW2042335.1 periplasmic heavy metal sensor [Deltaproteobacteria bacterium]MBW2133173.1 periplasmic heavy metal sensor [Deltaproteobacteria bacterium]